MKIVFLMIMGLERPGGRRYFNIARELVRRGHSVRLLVLHPDLASCPQRRFVQEGVEVWYVGQMHARKRGGEVERFGALMLLRVLVEATLGFLWGIISSPADIYHLGKPQPVNGLAAILGVLLLRRKPFYVDCDDDEVQSNRLTASWQRVIFGFWQGLLPRLAAGVTVNTRFLEERMRRMGVRRVAYVPNGVADDWFSPPDEHLIAGLRAALGLEGRRIIAYAGTLALQNHPVDLLIDAFAILAPAYPTVDLILIGGGEDLGLLRERAQVAGLRGRIHFTGQVAHQAVALLLALAELSVDPVHNDAAAQARSPLKIVESMALGIPVITGDVGDRQELLGPGGLAVMAGSATALAAGIVALLDDEEQRRAMGRQARERAEQYRWERLAEGWALLYEVA